MLAICINLLSFASLLVLSFSRHYSVYEIFHSNFPHAHTNTHACLPLAVHAAYPWLYNNMLTGVALHLKPMPYLDGTLALRVLGKLGGHNQALATTELPQTCRDWAGADDSEVCIVCRCIFYLSFCFPLPFRMLEEL